MRPLKATVALTALLALAMPAAAQAQFGFTPGTASVTAIEKDGTVATQASSHPYAFIAHVDLNLDKEGNPEGGDMRSARALLPPGFYGNPEAVPTCSRQGFENGVPDCPPSTQVGVLHATVTGLAEVKGAIYNVEPPHGIAAVLGFSSGGSGLVVQQYATLDTEHEYRFHVVASDIPLGVNSVTETIWGTPADPSHDPERGSEGAEGGKGTTTDAPLLPYLTLPVNCRKPLATLLQADSVLAPGVFAEIDAPIVDAGGNPTPMTGCDSVPFEPTIAAAPTTKLAESPSGLDFELHLPNKGLTDRKALAETEPEKIEVTLPEGVTVNPSASEGIGVCSEAQYKAEQAFSKPSEGCPDESKLGSIDIHTPLISETIEGSLYLAKPYENPFGSLFALYLVARGPGHGILVKQAGEIQPDPKTGQLITTFEGLPALPYSNIHLHFREGGRAPLVSPPSCGEYETLARLYPASEPEEPLTVTAPFMVERGADGGACPSGALPFNPTFEAGAINNNAGAYSPFNMQLTRRDGDQDLTKFSAKLPPGVVGRLAGTAQCPVSAIAQARSRQGEHGGQEEKENPSCPANSQIGRVLAGAGVGAVLTYVPGKLYLSGPYNGAPLSVVAIVPAVAGPFDAGTVVTQEALRINPLTAEVEADGSSSDPIPHILRGIPLKVRDLRVYVDKPDFTLNPTSCDRSASKATIWSGGFDVFSAADDSPHSLESRFVAANCASLGFKPRLSLSLKGGTRRGAHPALTGTYRPRPGDANTKSLVLTLPHSAFLDQGHIRTICTRVQFAANGGAGRGCPAGAVYGKAKAFTPLLDEPLEGPVFLRSSNHNLPDFVASLHGLVDVEAVARIDSKHGGIRATFNTIPDAPLTKVVVQMQGAKKGLIVNSTNLCAGSHRADARFAGHNGKRSSGRPEVGASGCGKAKHGKRHDKHGRQG
jgi:hypothetical protein